VPASDHLRLASGLCASVELFADPVTFGQARSALRSGYTFSRNRPPVRTPIVVLPKPNIRSLLVVPAERIAPAFRDVRVEEDSGEVTPRRFNTSRSRSRHPGWPSCGRITQASHRKARFRFGSRLCKNVFPPPKLHATGGDPRRHDGLRIFLLYRVRSQPGRKLGPR
jgi:hypothetical protein